MEAGRNRVRETPREGTRPTSGERIPRTISRIAPLNRSAAVCRVTGHQPQHAQAFQAAAPKAFGGLRHSRAPFHAGARTFLSAALARRDTFGRTGMSALPWSVHGEFRPPKLDAQWVHEPNGRSADFPVCGFWRMRGRRSASSPQFPNRNTGLESPANPQTGKSALRPFGSWPQCASNFGGRNSP